MSAAVATRSSLPSSRMAATASSDKKELSKRASPARPAKDQKAKSPPRTEPSKDKAASDTNAPTAPLAPPPRPVPTTATDSPDYFSGLHNNTTSFALEPNPFEQSFGNPADTPGKSLLPPVAALTSPASLLGGGPHSSGFSWANSLRAGPLSPAMLTGPTAGADIFESHYKSFPTPNESSLRTGLTPGGGGSMFPMASPNPLFGNLASGGATPSAIDFHRTALSAAAASSRNKENGANGGSYENAGATSSIDPQVTTSTTGIKNAPSNDYSHVDANDAANGLFMLAQAKHDSRNAQAGRASKDDVKVNGARTGDASPVSDSKELNDGSESGKSEGKPNTRSRGKKAPAKKATNNRRKAEGPPAGSKAPASKRSRGSSMAMMEDDDEMDEDDDMDDDDSALPKDTRKMTDEEKRKNFLERNRVAALKCRQRKKQWLANLQTKVEFYSSENEALNAQLAQLRQEVVNLKTLLLAHKDCPVTQSQGLTGLSMGGMNDFSQHPYNMAMTGRGQIMAGQNNQRRFS